MEPPITPDPSNKLLLRLFHYQRNGKPKSKFVFIHEVRVILKKLKMLGVEFAKGGGELRLKTDNNASALYWTFGRAHLQHPTAGAAAAPPPAAVAEIYIAWLPASRDAPRGLVV